MSNAQVHGCAFEGWQCFHCGEIFTTIGGAEDHFGAAEGTTPGCLLKVELGNERGWLMDFREKEKRITKLEQQLAELLDVMDSNAEGKDA